MIELYRVAYVIDGVTYFFVDRFQFPRNDPKIKFIFKNAAENNKKMRGLDGTITNLSWELQPGSAYDD